MPEPEQVKYIGKTRRGAGLRKGGVYEVVDSTSWKTMIKIKTSTGAEAFCPVHVLVRENPTTVPQPGLSIRFCKFSLPNWISTDLGRRQKAAEVRGLGLHLTLITR